VASTFEINGLGPPVSALVFRPRNGSAATGRMAF